MEKKFEKIIGLNKKLWKNLSSFNFSRFWSLGIIERLIKSGLESTKTLRN